MLFGRLRATHTGAPVSTGPSAHGPAAPSTERVTMATLVRAPSQCCIYHRAVIHDIDMAESRRLTDVYPVVPPTDCVPRTAPLAPGWNVSRTAPLAPGRDCHTDGTVSWTECLLDGMSPGRSDCLLDGMSPGRDTVSWTECLLDGTLSPGRNVSRTARLSPGQC